MPDLRNVDFVTVAGLILAGGRASRFGGRKEEALLRGRPLIDHVLARAAPQVATLAISRAGDDPGDNRGLPAVVDRYQDHGPLAGLHAGLVWAAALSPPVTHLATFPCDTPLIAKNHVARLSAALSMAGAAIPVCRGALHPALGLWSINLATVACEQLGTDEKSLLGFAAASGAVAVEFEDETAFLNVNTMDDLAIVEAALGPR